MMKETPVFGSAAVAAPHDLAAEAGRAILSEGGNALEAMIAMGAAIAVVYPHMTGIGGDGFWVFREPSGKAGYIEAAGFAGAGAAIDAYREKGLERMPLRGIDAANTVPGAVGGWALALEAARALGGRLPFEMLMYEAARLAREGFPVSKAEARYDFDSNPGVVDAPNFKAAYFIDGKKAAAGASRKFPALAATLEQLARAGTEDFYRGDISREIALDMHRLGVPVTRADLAEYRAVFREPLMLRLKDAALYNAQPPSQGLTQLMIQGIFEQLNITKRESFEFTHGLVETIKRALAVRLRVVTDFDRMKHDAASFLTDEALAREAAAIDMQRAAPWPFTTQDGDTIWMGAIDKNGLAVSYIQSLFWGYGSGVVLPSTGILLQNRGAAFSLDPGAVNPLEPGRRPFHTLNAPLAAFDDGRVCSYGTMGGDSQPQITGQTFQRAFRFGMSVSEALDAPRFIFEHEVGGDHAHVRVESRFDPAVVRALERAGHRVEVKADAYSDAFGHSGMLVRHPGGRIEADHDPRSDGGARGM